nr:helix-turn-helix domain-containing protein [Flavobacterium psychroterrae]
MENLKSLFNFFSAIEKDFRISSTHIAIYAALLRFREDKGFINPIFTNSEEIKTIAKISSPKTYFKCIKELNEYGYLVYMPTSKRNQKSKIYFLTD